MRCQILLLRMPLKKNAEVMSLFLSQPNTVVMFFDEGRFGLQPNTGRCWALRGKTHRIQVQPGYKFFYVYAGVSPTTGDSFILLLPWVNTEIMNVYLQELSYAYSDRWIMIFMDQAGWHKSQTLTIPENIHINYLPPYSPELNPVEKLWLWLRRHGCRNRLYKSENELMDSLGTLIKNMSYIQLKQLCNCNYLSYYN